MANFVMNVIFLIGMFLAVLYTIVNVSKLLAKSSIPAGNFILQTIGIVLCIIKFLMYKNII